MTSIEQELGPEIAFATLWVDNIKSLESCLGEAFFACLVINVTLTFLKL